MIEFDFGSTLVQVARYPGEGRSSYVCHCDCKKMCWLEPKERGKDAATRDGDGDGEEDNGGMAAPLSSKRIITAVYYISSPSIGMRGLMGNA